MCSLRARSFVVLSVETLVGHPAGAPPKLALLSSSTAVGRGQGKPGRPVDPESRGSEALSARMPRSEAYRERRESSVGGA